jgi:hypothetical protein
MECCGRRNASTWPGNESVRAVRGQRRRPESAFRIPVSVGVFGRLHWAPQNGCTPGPGPQRRGARRTRACCLRFLRAGRHRRMLMSSPRAAHGAITGRCGHPDRPTPPAIRAATLARPNRPARRRRKHLGALIGTPQSPRSRPDPRNAPTPAVVSSSLTYR